MVEIRGLSHNSGGVTTGHLAGFAALGDQKGGTQVAPVGTTQGFQGFLQDQNGSTSESFDFCIVLEDTVAGFPAPSPVGNPVGPEVLLRSSSLASPAPLSGTPQAWIVTAEFLTPLDVIPHKATWYLGSGVSSNPAWSNDGASIQMASYGGLGTPFPNFGDNPYDDGSTSPTTVAFTRDVTNGTRAASASTRGHHLHMLTAAPLFNWGANIVATAQTGPNPNYGVAGMFPDVNGVGNASRIAGYGPPQGYTGRPASFQGTTATGDGITVKLESFTNIGETMNLYVNLTGNITAFTLPIREPPFIGLGNKVTGSLIVPVGAFVGPLPVGPTFGVVPANGTLEGAFFGAVAAPGTAPFTFLSGLSLGGQFAGLVPPNFPGDPNSGKVTFSNAATVTVF